VSNSIPAIRGIGGRFAGDPGADGVGMQAARDLFVMLKKTCKSPHNKPPRGPWPTVLVEMAAANRDDGGVGLQHLLQEAGFAQKPAMTIIVKRPRARLVDPHVDDVLDALRALCA